MQLSPALYFVFNSEFFWFQSETLRNATKTTAKTFDCCCCSCCCLFFLCVSYSLLLHSIFVLLSATAMKGGVCMCVCVKLISDAIRGQRYAKPQGE